MGIAPMSLVEKIGLKLVNGKVPTLMEQAVFRASGKTGMGAQMKLKVGESITQVLPSGTKVTVKQIREGVFEKTVVRAKDGRKFVSVFHPDEYNIGNASTLEDIGFAHRVKFTRGNFDDFYVDGVINKAHISGGRNNGLLSLKIDNQQIDIKSSQIILDSLKAYNKVTGAELQKISPNLIG